MPVALYVNQQRVITEPDPGRTKTLQPENNYYCRSIEIEWLPSAYANEKQSFPFSNSVNLTAFYSEVG